MGAGLGVAAEQETGLGEVQVQLGGIEAEATTLRAAPHHKQWQSSASSRRSASPEGL